MARASLILCEEHRGYNAEDLRNATLIFSNVLMDLAYSDGKRQNFDQKQLSENALSIGRALKTLVESTTNITLNPQQ